MATTLPAPGPRYDQTNEAQTRRQIASAIDAAARSGGTTTGGSGTVTGGTNVGSIGVLDPSSTGTTLKFKGLKSSDSSATIVDSPSDHTIDIRVPPSGSSSAALAGWIFASDYGFSSSNSGLGNRQAFNAAIYASLQPTHTGTATGATSTSLTDSAFDFTGLAGVATDWAIAILTGAAKGQEARITSVTGTHQANVASWPLGITPSASDQYIVIHHSTFQRGAIKPVLLPPGSFAFQGPGGISSSVSVRIQGAGMQHTLLQPTGMTAPGTALISFNGCTNAELSDFAVDSGDMAQRVRDVIWLHKESPNAPGADPATSTTQNHLRRIAVTGWWDNCAIRVGNDSHETVQEDQTYIESCRIFGYRPQQYGNGLGAGGNAANADLQQAGLTVSSFTIPDEASAYPSLVLNTGATTYAGSALGGYYVRRNSDKACWRIWDNATSSGGNTTITLDPSEVGGTWPTPVNGDSVDLVWRRCANGIFFHTVATGNNLIHNVHGSWVVGVGYGIGWYSTCGSAHQCNVQSCDGASYYAGAQVPYLTISPGGRDEGSKRFLEARCTNFLLNLVLQGSCVSYNQYDPTAGTGVTRHGDIIHLDCGGTVTISQFFGNVDVWDTNPLCIGYGGAATMTLIADGITMTGTPLTSAYRICDAGGGMRVIGRGYKNAADHTGEETDDYVIDYAPTPRHSYLWSGRNPVAVTVGNVTGSKGGNTALADLITKLVTLGVLPGDSTT